MSSLKFPVDNNPLHLYPPFREKLQAVFAEMKRRTGKTWQIAEGYRSADRQLWLYGQGRPWFQPYGRPGQVVTWKMTPTWHGTGIAADCYPNGNPNAPHSDYVLFRQVYQAQGLANPAWENGDFGHVQWTDQAVRLKSLAWVRRGFPNLVAPPVITDPPSADHVDVYACLPGTAPLVVEGADGTNQIGRVQFWCRPVFEALNWQIVRIDGTGESRDAVVAVDMDGVPGGPTEQFGLPVRLKPVGQTGRAYCWAHDVQGTGLGAVRWQDGALYVAGQAADLPTSRGQGKQQSV